MVAAGRSQAEIAAELGVTDRQVRRLLKRPEAVTTIEAAQEQVRAIFSESAAEIGEELTRLAVEAEKEESRIAAGRVVLDRIGIIGGSKLEHSGAVGGGESTDELRARIARLQAALDGTEEPE